MFIHVWTLSWVFLLLLPFVSSQTTQSSPLPFVLPLAIKSPSLHAWTKQTNLNGSWPMFWNRDNLGWEGLIRVDNQAYQWLGKAPGINPVSANVTNIQITPTRTIYTYAAGPAQLTATFLSPIERSDPVKQSIPFSYISVDINFTDGLQHDVQLYMDISAEFITKATRTSDIVTWSTSTSGTSSSKFHQIQLNMPTTLVEDDNRAQDMIAVLGAQSGPSVSAVEGEADSSRRTFSTNGVATGTLNTPPVQMGNPWPVFTVVQSLGNISATTSPVVFVLGIYRNPSILLTTTTSTGKTQSQTRAPLFAASLSSISDVIDAFLSDFPDAKSRADELDSLILSAAGNISEPYKDLVSLAARQTMGSTELTIANGTDGKWNMSDIKMFMKDVGDSGRINPVEKIYASFPFFLFINSTYTGQLLSPLLEAQDSSMNDQAFAARDLGQNYPQAFGTFTAHQQQVEHTSSMLIMAYAHARISGDGTLISGHYSLLRKWAEYLVNSTMSPPDKTTVDDEILVNSTNLVIKGIIALKAMSEISNAVSLTDDANRYSQFSSNFMNQWTSLTQTLGGDGHLPLSLGGSDSSSWGLMYNLYADKLLNTSIIADQTFQNQAQFYQSLLSQSSGGLPLDSTSTFASVAWSLFTAATITDSTIRNNLISSVHNQFFKEQANDTQPFPVNYNVDGSSTLKPKNANPAVGAIFAPLALSLTPAESVTIPPPIPPAQTQTTSEKHRSIAGPVAGGVVGGLALLLLIALGIFCVRRRNRTEIPYVEAFTTGPNIVTYEGLTLLNHQDPTLPPQRTQREEPSCSLGVSEKQAPDNSVSTPSSSREPPTTPSAVSGSSQNTGRSGRSGRSRGTDSRSNRSQLSATEVQGLRSEVENLRRFMQQIQVERIEAPPSYAL